MVVLSQSRKSVLLALIIGCFVPQYTNGAIEIAIQHYTYRPIEY